MHVAKPVAFVLRPQVGPCEGIEAGDMLWMSRYLMHRRGLSHISRSFVDSVECMLQQCLHLTGDLLWIHPRLTSVR